MSEGTTNWRRELERRAQADQERITALEAELAEARAAAEREAELAPHLAANREIDEVTSGAEPADYGPRAAVDELYSIPLLNAEGNGFNPNFKQQVFDVVKRNGGEIRDEEPGRWLKGGHGRDGRTRAVTTPER